MTIGLTKRQKEILEFIQWKLTDQGYPPSFREVAAHFGIRSTNGVKVHYDALEKKGYIRRNPRLARGIELTELAGAPSPADTAPGLYSIPPSDVSHVPVIGRVAAGAPILAEENLDGYVVVDNSFIHGDGVFALVVKGESMKDAGIFHSDYVLGKPASTYFPGDIVVAIIGDEATVKRYYPEGGRVRLEPANQAYGPIIVEENMADFRIAGKVIGVMRRM
ncbi:transcriptional repressor LexA [candidate division KSB1 bacterium]